MKYGEHLLQNIAIEYGQQSYLNYSYLDAIIRTLSRKGLSSADEANRQVSLTAPPPTNAKGIPQQSNDITEEAFFSYMDSELTKVEKFTLEKVTELRRKLDQVESKVKGNVVSPEKTIALKNRADGIARLFLTLEKYVNINFMGFHKILKKHDKHCPANPCKTFYVSRMQSQAWVRGDYSDVVVRLSGIYSSLRNDQVVKEKADASQSFLRSTTKYWVKTEDVSRVKYAVLRNLPVFLQKTSTGESDSQLTNSVYLDNDQLELYHGRLDKSPGALALRLRWYGTGEPSVVFAERKTHRDNWIGEVSVKERFMIKGDEVEQVMNDRYPIEEKKTEMLRNGKTTDESDDWEALVREVTQVISSKQLVPTMRTQYMRTAFQIPFDATVRISLDTNLCMISERGYDLKGKTVWHRDSNLTLARDEITRFPHAVLEVKLELKGENASPPLWVTELQNSGMLYEVHKFSKFIHGCSIMLPEDVRAVPYWVDDASLRESIMASGGGRILVRDDLTDKEKKQSKFRGVGPGANEVFDHLLPFGDVENDRTLTAEGRTASSRKALNEGISAQSNGGSASRKYGNYFHDENEDVTSVSDDRTCAGWLFSFCSPDNHENLSIVTPTSVQKVEPKIFLANERTFLHWLHAGVTLYTISTGIFLFASDEDASWAVWYAMAMLPVALGFCIYALHTFLWRSRMIKNRIPGRWDDPRGPMILGSSLVVILSTILATQLYEIRITLMQR
mmetsp:Transcript_6886/g.7970  ORF Transcript_6886/g.7970 Transcript_6886/m.7970 type:complete len:733 (-) Transcript_6886:165-2363(-)|eukprot:CAMPEP_0198254920 /NCGR_PEP_ID=MMETSP1447-20131203/5163_1 /TAXON_ID=420782 /ORGANISM="Chaetoceros dichaeta, Strain CCMP1751" /LENGTH=732 /DNA_ID=CAMNT_0043941169 /DNA_START=39 /DNA_END=2237 /DNA_ORIENTATION=+